jgi:hypothetical protein
LQIGKSRLGGFTYGGIVQEVTLLCVLDLPDDITKLGCDALVPRPDYDRADASRYHSRDCHCEKNRQEAFASLVGISAEISPIRLMRFHIKIGTKSAPAGAGEMPYNT